MKHYPANMSRNARIFVAELKVPNYLCVTEHLLNGLVLREKSDWDMYMVYRKDYTTEDLLLLAGGVPFDLPKWMIMA